MARKSSKGNTKRRNNKKRIIKKKQIKKGVCFAKAIGQIKKHIISQKPKTVGDAAKVALRSTKKFNIKPTRIVKIPKRGGLLPLIPIFAGLSALETITGGAAGVA